MGTGPGFWRKGCAALEELGEADWVNVQWRNFAAS